MSEWNQNFTVILDELESKSAVTGTVNDSQKMWGLLHAFILSWQYENNCLVWVTEVPGNNLFGSTVVFVNDKVLQQLQWTFEEWEDGTAPANMFLAEEAKNVNLHLNAKSSLPIHVHIRKKNTPPAQAGDDYVLHIHYDLPYNLRLTVGVPL